MENTCEGWVHLANLLFDVLRGRIEDSLVRQFLGDVGGRIAARGPGVSAVGVTQVAIYDGGDDYLCAGPEVGHGVARCSRVMLARHFGEYNLDWGRVGWPRKRRLTPGQVAHLARHGLVGKVRGTIKGELPLAWVTKSEILADLKVIAVGPRLADLVRTRLGLEHYVCGDHAVELIYPDGVPPGTELRAPTALDSWCGRIYRSCDGGDGWGRTVDLETLADAMPEAVHPELVLSGAFGFDDLGRVQDDGTRVEEVEYRCSFPVLWTAEAVRELEHYV
jgi:hypothetical protein